ncbi:MAG: glycosyl transferase family 2 [uncultured bacterium]|nr:MAG: glycosyl transferase family 2 [uncultured bacterium]
MQQSTTKVTIGLPVYNGEKYVEQAIKSVLSQTFTNFKLIISDNASSDRTEEICRGFAATDCRITYLRRDSNLGAINNFQSILESTDSEYFMWLASDDMLIPNFLDRAVATLDQDTGCGLVFCDYLIRNLETSEETAANVCSSNSKHAFIRCLIRLLDMCPSMIYGLFRLSCLKNVNLENFDFADVHFVMQIAIKDRIKILCEPGYIAGVKGYRKPYSLTGKKISRSTFLKKEISLFFSSLPMVYATFLSILAILVMIKNSLELRENT